MLIEPFKSHVNDLVVELHKLKPLYYFGVYEKDPLEINNWVYLKLDLIDDRMMIALYYNSGYKSKAHYVCVTGNHFWDNQLKERVQIKCDSISYNPDKGAEKCAKDIVNRFLPNYLDSYNRKIAELIDKKDYEEKLANDLKKIRHFAKSDYTYSNTNKRDFYLAKNIAGVYLFDGGVDSPNSVKMDLRSLPVDLAINIIDLIYSYKK